MGHLVALTDRIGALEQPVDARIAELARRQHGAVATWQLYVLGLSYRAVRRRVESGRLHPVYRGVYAVGHPKLTERGNWMAAVLAYGKDALLSHRSCAGLRSLMPDGRARIDVTVPGRSRHPQGRAVPHLPRSLHPDDIDVHDGIPCTSVARTLLDVGATEQPRVLERIFEAAERERVLDLRKVAETLERSRGHTGRRPLTALTEQFHDPPATIRSKLERRFLGLCDRAGVPRPAVNVNVEGHEVDMFWEGPNVIVELDSWEFHRTRAAFERDRRRDVDLRLKGYIPLRFTWIGMRTEPDALIDAVVRAIELASAA